MKRVFSTFIFPVVLFLVIFSPAQASITRLSSTNFNQGGSGSFSRTITSTLSGSPTIAVIGGFYNGISYPTGITYNGVAMTPIFSTLKVAAPTEVTNGGFYAAYIINPPTGAQSVVITKNAVDNVYAFIASYSGTDTVAPIGVNGTFSSGSSPQTINLTTASVNSWIGIFGELNGAVTVALNGGNLTDLSSGNQAYYDSNAVVGVTSNSVVTSGFSSPAAVGAFELIPSANITQSPFYPFILLFGDWI